VNKPIQLVSELLRPQQLSDLTLPQPVVDRLQIMIDTDSVMNMLFYGQPGTGKTSAARVIMTQLGPYRSREINGSTLTGVGIVRDEVERFARGASLFVRNQTKLCFIDEADYISKPAQAVMRKVIEDSWKYCRFILAANEDSRLIPPLQSRLTKICFDVEPSRRREVKAAAVERYESKLTEYGFDFDKKRLDELVGLYYPDFRSIANEIQFQFAYQSKG
jgi:DNA polymerase III delta prime subunit